MQAFTFGVIPPFDHDGAMRVQARLDSRVKPRGSLGRLEALAVHLAGVTGRDDYFPHRRAVALFAADHGVARRGVSTVPQAVTAYMVGQFMAGNAAVNVLARQMGARLTVVDAGVNADLTYTTDEHARFIAGKIARGTADLAVGPAMTPEQAAASLALGARVAAAEIAAGADVLILGEMGIGNTTSASALIAAITGAPAAAVTGRGTGLDDAALAAKIALIEAALNAAPADADPLAQFGGFEIGAMAGAMLTAASQRVPVILDGLICTAAALVAARLNPAVTAYFIAGHRSAEPGHARALDYLRLRPLLELDMRLGEGTGALLALPLVEAAARLTHEMGALDAGLAG